MTTLTTPLSSPFSWRDFAWSADGACRYLGMHAPDDVKLDRCGHCPVAERCLEWALARREVGIWGGTDEEQRAEIRRRRRAEAAAQQPAVTTVRPARREAA